ncbi:prohibitin-like protein [Rhizoctonia solani]|uniref:Prohibitin-like protein n=1 Tax=Rhizoctonia solani TaxID=456999 RepID=A0A8H7I487_9AGAM|nr:prohibitin-like protein [Rhizoctonia solani]
MNSAIRITAIRSPLGLALVINNRIARLTVNPPLSFVGNSNVVDHNAPDVTGPEQPRRPPPANGRLITVEPLKRAEMQQSYAQDLGLDGVEHGIYGASSMVPLGAAIGFFGAFPCCPCPNPFQEVQQGSVGLVTRFGQFYKAVDPGLVQVNVCSEELRRVDVKIQIASIGRQTVITRTMLIESVIYYQITSPYRAAFGIADLRQALTERAQTTLRHVVGARVVQSVVTERDAIALEIEEIDITFPPDVAASLSSAAQAKRVGESKVIAARAEVDAARLMRQAADILASPAAMQIRQLEALQTMAKSAQSKVVFVPMSLQGDVSAQLSGGQWSASGSGHHDNTQSPGAGPSMLGGTQGPAQRAGLLTSMADL